MNSNFYPIKIWPRIAYFNGQSGKTKYFLNTKFNLKLKLTVAKLTTSSWSCKNQNKNVD